MCVCVCVCRGYIYLHGQRSLVGYNSWGCKELDMTEWLSTWRARARAHTHTHTHMYIKKVNMTLHSLLIQFSNLKAWRHLNRQIITQWYCKYRVHYRETVLLYEVQTFYKFISISEKKWRGHCSKEEKWHNLRIKGK